MVFHLCPPWGSTYSAEVGASIGNHAINASYFLWGAGHLRFLFYFDADGLQNIRGLFASFAAGAGEGPTFITRPGAPDEADLRDALDLLSARRVQLGGEEQATDQKDKEALTKLPAASRESPQHPMYYVCHGHEPNVVHMWPLSSSPQSR